MTNTSCVLTVLLLIVNLSQSQSSCDESECRANLKRLNCKCDNDCGLFNDCCLNYTPTNQASTDPACSAPYASASPGSTYVYAIGDNLKAQMSPQSFIGIRDLVTLGPASSPIDFSSVELSEPNRPTKKMLVSSIQSSSDYEEAFTTSSEVQGSYGGFSSSASAKYMQSRTLTSTTSLYTMSYEHQLGDMYLNSNAKLIESAKNMLLYSPERFVELYGRYYIYGISVGCQASATVQLTAKSEYHKKELDFAAKASFQGMFSASSSFESDMKSQSSFNGLSLSVFSNGGNVPSIASSIQEVRDKILMPLDTGGKCSKKNAIASRAMIRSWLAFQSIADLAHENPNITKILLPEYHVAPNVLGRMNNIIMKTKTLVQQSDKCHANVFSCSTKQWNEPTEKKEALYTAALHDLTIFQKKIHQVTEATLADMEAVFHFEQELENIYLKHLRPAEKVTPFTFNFEIRVLNDYDKYRDPPRVGTKNETGSFPINPNRQDTLNSEIQWNTQPQLDNGHSNCRHFYGKFYASYKANVLYVWQVWNRVCGGKNKKTKKVKYHPGGNSDGTSDYARTVRTAFSFTVDYK